MDNKEKITEDIKLNGTLLIAYWWEDDYLYLETEDGKITRMYNPYISNITYEGLDYDNKESIAIVGNNKIW
jgi:hypothetical protein